MLEFLLYNDQNLRILFLDFCLYYVSFKKINLDISIALVL